MTRSIFKSSLTTKLDSHIKNIENERDYFKQEVETLQKLLKAAQRDYELRSFNTCGTANSTSTTTHITDYNSPCATTSVIVNTNGSKSRASSNHKSRIEKDKTNVKGKSKSPSSSRCTVCANRSSKSPANSNNLRSSSSNLAQNINNEEIKQLKRERDELKSLLDKFERHMSEVSAQFSL